MHSILGDISTQENLFDVFQSDFKHEHLYVNYLLQVIRELANNKEKTTWQSAFTPKEFAKIISLIQTYKLKTKEILEIIINLDQPLLGINQSTLADTKEALYLVLDLSKMMDDYVAKGARCRFAPAEKLEEVVEKDSPMVNPESLKNFDEKSRADIYKKDNELFVVGKCWGSAILPD